MTPRRLITRRALLAALAAVPVMGVATRPAAARFSGLIQRGVPPQEPPPAPLPATPPAPLPRAAAVEPVLPPLPAEAPAAVAEVATALDPRPAVCIVIDDIGNLQQLGRRALHLPGTVTCSFLPNTPYARELADEAGPLGREIILHVPMQSVHHIPLGPGGLTAEMGRSELLRTMRDNLAALPQAHGVSNHMGSLLTRRAEAMGWVMESIRAGYGDGRFFLDSVTTPSSIAWRAAEAQRIPTFRRDIFLDNEPKAQEVRRQFEALVAEAQRKGTALAIGHPHPETLAVLEELLPTLERRGVRLVTVRDMIRLTPEGAA